MATTIKSHGSTLVLNRIATNIWEFVSLDGKRVFSVLFPWMFRSWISYKGLIAYYCDNTYTPGCKNLFTLTKTGTKFHINIYDTWVSHSVRVDLPGEVFDVFDMRMEDTELTFDVVLKNGSCVTISKEITFDKVGYNPMLQYVYNLESERFIIPDSRKKKFMRMITKYDNIVLEIHNRFRVHGGAVLTSSYPISSRRIMRYDSVLDVYCGKLTEFVM